MRQAVRTCRHLIECAIPGTFAQCLAVVKEYHWVKKQYDFATLTSWQTESCDTLKKKVVIVPPRPAGGGGGGYSTVGGFPNGYFGGSWVDGSGNVHSHDPPPRGYF